MRKQIFTLLTLALLSTGAAWADDVVSATQTFTDNRSTCTWTSLSASVTKGNSASGDGLYLVAGSAKNISTSTGTIQMGKDAGGIIYVEVPSAASTGTITLWSNGNQAARKVYLNSGNSIQMSTAGASSAFVATDVANVNGGYYVKLVNSDASDYKFNQDCA